MAIAIDSVGAIEVVVIDGDISLLLEGIFYWDGLLLLHVERIRWVPAWAIYLDI